MRWVVAVFLIITLAVGIAVSFLPKDRVGRLEGELHYSMGLVGERRLFSFCEGGDASFSVTSSKNATMDSSVFTSTCASATFCFDPKREDIASAIAEKVPIEGEIDYRGFAFADRIPPLIEPLSDIEVAYVFAQIVSTATAKVPIDGELAEITFDKEGDELRAVARITLGLTRLAEKYRLIGFPSNAAFCVSMQFSLKDSHISVDFDNISVECETMDLPEALLLFGCNLAFGKKDYKELFGNAVKNVFVNARIYL